MTSFHYTVVNLLASQESLMGKSLSNKVVILSLVMNYSSELNTEYAIGTALSFTTLPKVQNVK